MALAFELPEHLPRSREVQDKSTSILTRVGQTSNHSLNATIAASWLTELEGAIHDTKTRISKRIRDNLPDFERQLKSSTSVQTRLGDLSTGVDHLTGSLNDPKTGILPSLLYTLSTHGRLTQQANDSDITYNILAYLLRIHDELHSLSTSMQEGELPESAQACGRIQKIVADAPPLLERADIMSDINKTYRTLNDRVQEQLGDAFARSIIFTTSPDAISLTILPVTPVFPTSTDIGLPAILCSLTPDPLSARLSTFRRNIMSRFVDPILLFSRPLTSSATSSSSILSLSTSTSTSTSSSTSSSPLLSLQTLLTFLDTYLFPHLPPVHAAFPTTFHSPIISTILTRLLEPSIPSSLPSLPEFLSTVDEAVRFEKSLLPVDARDRPISYWAVDVAGHYEKKRREGVLQHVREVIGEQEQGETVMIEVTLDESPVHSEEGHEDTDESGWDFDKEGDDVGASTSGTARSQNGRQGDTDSLSENAPDHGNYTRDGEDASYEWGWNDDDDSQGNAHQLSDQAPQATIPKPDEDEDDPWDDDGWAAEPAPDPKPDPGLVPVSVPRPAPKMARRLEKFSAKAKGFSASNTPVPSTVDASTPKPPPPAPPAPPAPQQQQQRSLRCPPKQKGMRKETYLVSVRAKTVLEIAKGLMQEGQDLMQSKVFAEHFSANTSTPGHHLVSAAPSVLDLHRALYPVMHSSALARDADLKMRWSNDCRFLSDEVARLRRCEIPALVEEKWAVTEDRLKLLGEACFEDVVARQQEAAQSIFVGAEGFANVSNGDRFEECKNAVEQVLREITCVARQWKVTLTRSAYLNAMGQIVDDALFRVMDDVLALEDIPEADSERLSELCDMLAPLEGLFTDTSCEQSVVGSYVPLWFKFSYLSWLIKGSIADLSYLFDQGTLVDYEIDELVRLLRALFADTPLREKTIAKISQGHPVAVDDY